MGFWEGIYQQIIDGVVESGDQSLSARIARTHGNWKLSAGTAIMAFLLSIFVLIDQIVCLCTKNGVSGDQNITADEDGDLALTPVGSNSQDAKGSYPKSKNWTDLT